MIVVWMILGAAAWALILSWLVSPWLELAALLFWTVALLYALERDHHRRR